MKHKALSPAEHVELGALLKCARNDLLSAAMMCRPFGKLSQQLLDTADALPRAWLEQRLVELVGADAMIEGVHCRDVYFGMEEIDAQAT
jgi:hypothetical protein